MSLYLNSSLTTSSQTLSLRASGAASLVLQSTLPMYLTLRRVSDGAIEIVRAVAQVSATDMTILRAQLGSAALAFAAGDSCDLLDVPISDTFIYIYLGSPALSATNAVHASITMTGSPQTITTAITNPDVCRNVSITGNASGNAGTVTIQGLDALGGSLSEDIALNGSSTVFGLKAFASINSISLPAETHAGTDSILIGNGPALGLPFAIARDTVFRTFRNGVKEGTDPTVTFGAVSVSKVTLNSALNGTPVSMYVING